MWLQFKSSNPAERIKKVTSYRTKATSFKMHGQAECVVIRIVLKSANHNATVSIYELQSD